MHHKFLSGFVGGVGNVSFRRQLGVGLWTITYWSDRVGDPRFGIRFGGALQTFTASSRSTAMAADDFKYLD